MRLRNKGRQNKARVLSKQQSEREAIGLGEVDNTSDADKPASTAVSQAIESVARSVQLVVPVWFDFATNVVMTNQPTGQRFFQNSDRHVFPINLSNYSECRLSLRVMVASASANTPEIYLVYRTAYSATYSDYSDINADGLACSLAATGIIDTGWVDLTSLARNEVFVALIESGGDGAADPEVNAIVLHFR